MTKLQNVVLSLLFAAFTAAPNGSAQTVPALTVQEVLSRNINGERAQQDRPIAHKELDNWERFFIAQLSEQLRASLNAKPK